MSDVSKKWEQGTLHKMLAFENEDNSIGAKKYVDFFTECTMYIVHTYVLDHICFLEHLTIEQNHWH